MELIAGADEIWIEDQNESGDHSPMMRFRPFVADIIDALKPNTAEKRDLVDPKPELHVQSPVTARQRLRQIVKAQRMMVEWWKADSRFQLDELAQNSPTLQALHQSLKELSDPKRVTFSTQ